MSVGAQVDQSLGGGIDARLLGRFGFADQRSNITAGVARGDGRHSISLNGYIRLDAANDWGDPLGVTSSLASLAFARDGGFYYRVAGAEVAGGHSAQLGSGAERSW